MDYVVHLYTKYTGVQWWYGLCSSSLTKYTGVQWWYGLCSSSLTIECAGKGSESFCTTIV